MLLKVLLLALVAAASTRHLSNDEKAKSFVDKMSDILAEGTTDETAKEKTTLLKIPVSKEKFEEFVKTIEELEPNVKQMIMNIITYIVHEHEPVLKFVNKYKKMIEHQDKFEKLLEKLGERFKNRLEGITDDDEDDEEEDPREGTYEVVNLPVTKAEFKAMVDKLKEMTPEMKGLLMQIIGGLKDKAEGAKTAMKNLQEMLDRQDKIRKFCQDLFERLAPEMKKLPVQPKATRDQAAKPALVTMGEVDAIVTEYKKLKPEVKTFIMQCIHAIIERAKSMKEEIEKLTSTLDKNAEFKKVLGMIAKKIEVQKTKPKSKMT